MESEIASQLARVASYQTLRLTHRGRKSGKRYEVTIWFVVDRDAIYLNGNIDTQWPRNLQANPEITISIGQAIFHGKAHLVTEPPDRERIWRTLIPSRAPVGRKSRLEHRRWGVDRRKIVTGGP